MPLTNAALQIAFSDKSLRDWLAGQALAGMLGNTDAAVGDLAHDAYLLADAMLTERDRVK